MKRIVSSLSILIVILTVAWWSARNSHAVAVDFYPFPFELELPLFLLVFAGAAIGISAAAVAGLTRRVQSHVRTRRAEKAADEAESRADALKEELNAPEQRDEDRMAALAAQETKTVPAKL